MKNKNISRAFIKKAFILPAILGSFVSIKAASLIWDANPSNPGVDDGSGIWGANNNWQSYPTLGTQTTWSDAGYDVVFGNGGTAGNVTINSDDTGNGNGVRLVNSIVFDSVGSGSYNIAGGRLLFAQRNAVIAAKTGVNARISSAIRQSGDLYIGSVNFTGTGAEGSINTGFLGRVILTQSLSSLSGSLKIRGGVLRLPTVSYLPSGLIDFKSNLTEYAILETSGKLTRAIGTSAGNINMSGGVAGFSAVGGKLTIELATSNIILNGATGANWLSDAFIFNTDMADSVLEVRNNIDMSTKDRSITVNSTAPGTEVILSGALTSNGLDFTKKGAGTLILSGGGSNKELLLQVAEGTVVLEKQSSDTVYAIGGIKNIALGATVKIGDNASGGNQIANIKTTDEWGSVRMSGGTLDLNGHSEGFGLLGRQTSATASTGIITSSSLGSITLTLGEGDRGSEAHYAGLIEDGVGVLSLVKLGTNKQFLYGTVSQVNTYTGQTEVRSGTLALARSGSTGTITDVISSNSNFVLKGGILDIGANVVQTFKSIQMSSNATISGDGTAVFTSSAPNLQIDGVLNVKNIIKNDANTLTLSSPLSKYTALTINGGEVVSKGMQATTLTINSGKLTINIGSGLWEGQTKGSWNSSTTANPKTAIKTRFDYSLTTDNNVYKGSQTNADQVQWIYSGYLYLSEAKTFKFIKSFDDYVFLKIGDTTIVNNSAYKETPVSSPITFQSGYYAIDVRFGNDSGGVGPVKTDGTGGLLPGGFALGYNTDGSGTFYEFLHDPSNGIYFTTAATTATLNLSPSSEIAVTGLGIYQVTTAVKDAIVGTPGDLIKTGNGLLILAGNGLSHTGLTEVREGTVKVSGDINNVQTSFQVDAGASLEFESTTARTLAKAITGQGTVVKSGSANFTLSNLTAFTGDVLVKQGLLEITSSTQGNITVWSGAQLKGTNMTLNNGILTAGRLSTVTPGDDIIGNVSMVGSSLVVGSNKGTIDTLTFKDTLALTGTAIQIDFANGGTDTIHVNNLDISGGSNIFRLKIDPNINPATLQGSYTLMSVSGTLTGSPLGGITMNTPRGTSFSYDTNSKSYIFSITGQLGYVKWTGIYGNTWDVQNTENWQNVLSGGADKFYNADFVLLDDSAVRKQLILAENVTVSSMTVNADLDYIISGSHSISGDTLVKYKNGTLFIKNDGAVHFDEIEINGGTVSIDVSTGITSSLDSVTSRATVITGSGTFEKTGEGTLILWGNNTYGNTVIKGGTLQIGNGGAAGTVGRGSVSIAQNAALAFDLSSADGVAHGDISGAGSVIQRGSGAITLDNANTYTGGTRIESGKVYLTQFSGTLNGLVSSSVGSGVVSFVNNAGAISFEKAIGSDWADGIVNSSKSPDFTSGTGTAIAYAQGNLSNDISLATTSSGVGSVLIESGNAQTTSASMFDFNPDTGDYESIAYTVSVWTQANLTGKISGGNSDLILEIGSSVSQGRGVIGLLNQDNDFSVSKIRISGGSLLITADGVLGATTNQLELAVNSTQYGGLIFGADNIVLDAARGINVSANTRIDTSNQDRGAYTGTILGVITGAGGIIKEGSGTLILAANSSAYTGSITVNNGNLQIGNSDSAVASNLGTGPIKLVGEGTNLIINSGDTTIANNIEGVGSLIQSGPGATTLSGNNTYKGGTTITGGTLVVGSGTAIPTTTALNVVSGTFDVNGHSVTIGKLSGNVGSIIINNGGAAGTLTVANRSDSIFGGSINDGNSQLSLTKSESGTMVLSGVNNYTGQTTIVDGSLSLAVDNAISGTSKVSITGSGASLSIGDTTQVINNVEIAATTGGSIQMLNGGKLTVLGTLDFGSNNGRIIDVGIGYRSDSKAILEAVLSGSGTITKQGAGTLVIQNAGSSLTGSFAINAGVVEVEHLNALGTAAISIGSGTFRYTGASANITTLKTIDTFTSDDATIDVYNAGTILTITTSISGKSLNKAGAGTLVINGAATYTGATVVSEGTLQIGTSGSLPSGTALVVQGTGVFDLNGIPSLTVGALSGNSILGVVTNSSSSMSTLIVGSAGGDDSYYGQITGNVAIEKDGAGMLILSGKNTNTGPITLKDGILRASEGMGLSANGALVILNGTLESRGRLVRDLGNGAGQIQLGDATFFASNPNATIGFAAVGGRLIVNVGNDVGNDRRLLRWDPSNPANTDVFAKEIVLGSVNADNIVEVRNDIEIFGNDLTLNVVDNQNSSSDYAIVSGSIKGTGNVIKEGLGKLVFTGSHIGGTSTYTGDTLIKGGTLGLAVSQALSDLSDIYIYGDVVVTDADGNKKTYATVLDVGGTHQKFATLNLSDGTNQGGYLQFSDGGVVEAGTINVMKPGTADGRRYVSVIDGKAYLNGTIVGDSKFVKKGMGTLVLGNSVNTGFTGGMAIDAGVLEVAQLLSLGVGNMEIGNATFRYTGISDNLGLLGAYALQSENATIDVVNANTNLTVTSVIGGASFTGMSLVKAGAGTLTLAGAYTGSESIAAGTSFAGDILVKQGIVRLGADNALPETAAINVEKTGTFDLAGHDVAVDDLIGVGSITNSSSTEGVLTIDRESGSTTGGEFFGSISGIITLVKEGTGVMTLSGNNTYSGKTIVKEGVFRTEGRGLSRSTQIVLQGGALEFVKPTTKFTRKIGDGSGAIKWMDESNPSNPVDVWFSASGGKDYTLQISLDNGAALHWDDSRGFLIGNSKLIFGSEVQDSYIDFQNALNLGSVDRTIVAYGNSDPNVVSDVSTMSGLISGSGGIIKTGDGTLRLSHTSNTYTGPTTIKEGVLEIVRINDGYGYSSLGRVSDYAQNIVIDGGTLRYVGTGEASDKKFSFGVGTGGGRLESSGVTTADSTTGLVTASGSLRLDSEMEIAFIGSGARTLTLGGSNKGLNELGNILGNDGGSSPTSLVKDGEGKWYLSSEQNSFSGSITVTGGWLKFKNSNAMGSSSSWNIDGWAVSHTEEKGGYIDLESVAVQKVAFLPINTTVSSGSLVNTVQNGQIVIEKSTNEVFHLGTGNQVYQQGGYTYFLENASVANKRWAVYSTSDITLVDSSSSSAFWSNTLGGQIGISRAGAISTIQNGTVQSGDKLFLMDGGRLITADFNRYNYINTSGSEVLPSDNQLVAFENGSKAYYSLGDKTFYNAQNVSLVTSSGVKQSYDTSKIGTGDDALSVLTYDGETKASLYFSNGKLAYDAKRAYYNNGTDIVEVQFNGSGDLYYTVHNDVTGLDEQVIVSSSDAAGKVFLEDGTALVAENSSFMYTDTSGNSVILDTVAGKKAFVTESDRVLSSNDTVLTWSSALNTINSSSSGLFSIGENYDSSNAIKVSNGTLTVQDNMFVINLNSPIGIMSTKTVVENGVSVRKDAYENVKTISLSAAQMGLLAEGKDVILSNKIALKVIDDQIVAREIATLDTVSKMVVDTDTTELYTTVNANINIGDSSGIGAINVDSTTTGSRLIVSGDHRGGTLVKYGSGELDLRLTSQVDDNALTFNAQGGTLILRNYADSPISQHQSYAGISDIADGATIRLTSVNTGAVYNGVFKDGASVNMSGGSIYIDSGIVVPEDNVYVMNSVTFTQREKIKTLTGYGNIIGVFNPDQVHAWEHSAIEVEDGYFAGSISDQTSKMYLIKTGPGTLVLYGNKVNKPSSADDYTIGLENDQTFVYRKTEDFSNQNTYSGGTFLHGGTISTYGNNVMSARTDLMIVPDASGNNGGMFKLNGFTQTLNRVEMNNRGTVGFTGGIDLGTGGYLNVEEMMVLQGGTLILGSNSGNVELDGGKRIFKLARINAESTNYLDVVVLTSNSLDEVGGILQVDSIQQINSVIDFGNGTGYVEILKDRSEVLGSMASAKTVRVGEGKDVYFQSFKYTDVGGRGQLSIQNMIKDGSGTFILKKNLAFKPILQQDSKIKVLEGTIKLANISDYSGDNLSYPKSEIEAMFTKETRTVLDLDSLAVIKVNVKGNTYKAVNDSVLDLNNTYQYVDSLIIEKYAFDQSTGLRSTDLLTKARIRLGGANGKLEWNINNSSIQGGIIDLDNYSSYTHQEGAWFSQVDLGTGGKLYVNDLTYWGKQTVNFGDGTGRVIVANSGANEISGTLINDTSGTITLDDVFIFADGLSHSFNLLDFTKAGSGAILLGDNVNIAATGDIDIQGGALIIAQSGSGTLVLDRTITASKDPYTEESTGMLVQQGDKALQLMGEESNEHLTLLASKGTVIFDKFEGKDAAEKVYIDANGKVVLNGNQQINDQGFISMNGGVFDMNGKSEVVAQLWSTNSASIVTNGSTETSTLTLGNTVAEDRNKDTIDYFAGSITRGAGDISIVKEGAGTLILAGDNTYSGGTMIKNGTVYITESTGLGDASVATNVLSFRATGDDTATLAVYGTEDIILKNNIDIQGTGYFDIGSTVTLEGQFIYNGSKDVSTLVKIGAGTLIFSDISNETFNGVIDVKEGILIANRHVGIVDINIYDGATLKGSGSTASIMTVEKGGILSPGNSVGKYTVGELYFNEGSIFDVEADALNIDQVYSLGDVVIADGSILKFVTMADLFQRSTVYDMLIANGSVEPADPDKSMFTDPANGFDLQYDLAFFNAGLIYNDTTVQLKLDRVNYADFADRKSERAVGGALDAIHDWLLDASNPSPDADMKTIISNLAPLTKYQGHKALQALSGSIHVQGQQSRWFASERFREQVSDRISKFDPYDFETKESMWAHTFGYMGDVDDDSTNIGYDYKGAGVVGGYDHRTDDGGVMGIAFYYEDGQAKTSHEQSKIDDFRLAGYLGMEIDEWTLVGSVTGGLQQYDTSRTIQYGSMNARKATADYDGYSFTLSVDAGYALDEEWTLIGGLDLEYLTRDGFKEKGAGAADVNADSDDQWGVASRLGFRYTINGFEDDSETRVYLQSFWKHRFNKYDDEMNATLAGGSGYDYSVKGPKLKQDSFIIGLGFESMITDDVTWYGDANAEFSGSTTGFGGNIGIRYNW